MNTKNLVSSVLIIIFLFAGNYAQNIKTKVKNFPILKGSYLGQKPPGQKPEIFAPGFISTANTEHGTVTFSPNRNEVFWAMIYNDPFKKKLLYSKEINGRWSIPQIAPFSLGNNEGNPIFSPDGTKIFFTSWRSLTANGKSKHYIMFIQKTKKGWSKPELIDNIINSISKFWQLSVSSNGNLYFNAEGKGIYCSEYSNNKYQKPYKIDLGFLGSTPYVSSNENYIIFSSSDRPDGYGEIDLFISYKKSDGIWTKGKNIGKKINSKFTEIWPIISPDGKYLFFTSSRGKNMDVYWVDAGFTEALKPK